MAEDGMRIDIHLHVHDEEGRDNHAVLRHIVNMLEVIHKQGEKLMASFQEVSDELTNIKSKVDEVKAIDLQQIEEIRLLKEQIAAGTPVTQEQLDALDAQADAILAALTPENPPSESRSRR